MGDVVPVAKTFYIECYRCKALYKTENVYYKGCCRIVEPCPICHYTVNQIGFGNENISKLNYWITKLWRIFWHGRIDLRKEDLNV